jgi:hypothetical protein
MFRVNVEGRILALSPEGLLDLLLDLQTRMQGIITRCDRGYVVDSLDTRCVLVVVTPLAEPKVEVAA